MENQEGIKSSLPWSRRAKPITSSSSSKPRHRQLTPIDPSADVAGSLPVRSPDVQPRQTHIRRRRYNNNSGCGLGSNRNHNVIMHVSSSSRNMNSYNGHVKNHHVNYQRFEWKVKSDSQTAGSSANNDRQQYGRVTDSSNQARGRNSINTRINYVNSSNPSEANSGDLQKPLCRVKTISAGIREISLNSRAGIDGSKQDHMNASLKPVDKGKGRKSYKQLVSCQLDIPGPDIASNPHTPEEQSIEWSLSDDDIIISNKYISDEKNQMPTSNCEPSAMYTETLARGRILLSPGERKSMSQMKRRGDVEMLASLFLAKYESLIPAAEKEKAKEKQVYTLVERLVSEEWPEAQLCLFGSRVNSFAASTSDMDFCLSFRNAYDGKSSILFRLARILKSHDFWGVRALTRTRVPIVRFVDTWTGISCDLCVNNPLSVENTKLLRLYAGIDARLRQLVIIVKHWAKRRGVNETYYGTLSSYAYALMCIHFLQQRKPAILPCLQGMEKTYSVRVDGYECAYFDRVKELRCFGSDNKENIAELVSAFFYYWAYCHDYENVVISVRTGSIISKRSKGWTNNYYEWDRPDRHFISIEDPFDIDLDSGGVINEDTYKVMRTEFERAADIMQFDSNPCVKLFKP